VCVPLSNIDNETMTFKKAEDFMRSEVSQFGPKPRSGSLLTKEDRGMQKKEATGKKQNLFGLTDELLNSEVIRKLTSIPAHESMRIS